MTEVLIALSIVGVVAAITIPQLVNKYNAKGFEVLELKAKETLSQAFDIYMTDIGKNQINKADFATKAKIEAFLTKYTRGKTASLSGISYKTSTNQQLIINGLNNFGCVKTNDGIVMCLQPINNTWGMIVIDTNGSAPPNMRDKDLIITHRYFMKGFNKP
jgi:type II secretory pathway pseudopilin PulG